MIGEIGEVIDIIKKHGDIKATNDVGLRKDLLEEMADVLVMIKQLMYLFDCKKEVQSMMKYKVDRQIKRIQLEVEEDNKK